MQPKKNSKVLIFGAGGRVGLGLISEFMRNNIDVVAIDNIDESLLSQKVARLAIDNRISTDSGGSAATVYGNIDVLDEAVITPILAKEQPDAVVNYAIPFTWDAAKQLDNYDQISRAGLGAFSCIQVLAPRTIAGAIAQSGISTLFVVGNLPDITVPVIHKTSTGQNLALPICGAGNVGLIEAGLRHQISLEHGVDIDQLKVHLVAHHIHWVAPREPGYSNEAPFLLSVSLGDKDLTPELGDLRALMNRSIVNGYEAGAGFSSTTSRLAAENIMALLGNRPCRRHVPAPNGLPGGYPVMIENGAISLDLPPGWSESQVVETMLEAHTFDGIDKIGADGTIFFNAQSVDILRKEMGFSLPLVVSPNDLEAVAREQILSGNKLLGAL
ncbi:MAG: NAD-dependent epimerase/dehydratase family protein [Porticoccaceae bacterium]|jgi:hypothetical protein